MTLLTGGIISFKALARCQIPPHAMLLAWVCCVGVFLRAAQASTPGPHTYQAYGSSAYHKSALLESLQCYNDYTSYIRCSWTEKTKPRTPVSLHHLDTKAYRESPCLPYQPPVDLPSGWTTFHCQYNTSMFAFGVKDGFLFRTPHVLMLSRAFNLSRQERGCLLLDVSQSLSEGGGAMLRWQTCLLQSPATKYQLSYRPLEGDWQVVEVSETAWKIEADSLVKGSWYEAKVKAQVGMGTWTEWSPLVQWKTKDTMLPGPTNLQCISDAKLRVLCSWELSKELAQFVTYRLRYRSRGMVNFPASVSQCSCMTWNRICFCSSSFLDQSDATFCVVIDDFKFLIMSIFSESVTEGSKIMTKCNESSFTNAFPSPVLGDQELRESKNVDCLQVSEDRVGKHWNELCGDPKVSNKPDEPALQFSCSLLLASQHIELLLNLTPIYIFRSFPAAEHIWLPRPGPVQVEEKEEHWKLSWTPSKTEMVPVIYETCYWCTETPKERDCYNTSVTHSDISQASLWSGSRYTAQVRAMIGPSEYRGNSSDWSEPVEWTTPPAISILVYFVPCACLIIFILILFYTLPACSRSIRSWFESIPSPLKSKVLNMGFPAGWLAVHREQDQAAISRVEMLENTQMPPACLDLSDPHSQPIWLMSADDMGLYQCIAEQGWESVSDPRGQRCNRLSKDTPPACLTLPFIIGPSGFPLPDGLVVNRLCGEVNPYVSPACQSAHTRCVLQYVEVPSPLTGPCLKAVMEESLESSKLQPLLNLDSASYTPAPIPFLSTAPSQV